MEKRGSGIYLSNEWPHLTQVGHEKETTDQMKEKEKKQQN